MWILIGEKNGPAIEYDSKHVFTVGQTEQWNNKWDFVHHCPCRLLNFFIQNRIRLFCIWSNSKSEHQTDQLSFLAKKIIFCRQTYIFSSHKSIKIFSLAQSFSRFQLDVKRIQKKMWFRYKTYTYCILESW